MHGFAVSGAQYTVNQLRQGRTIKINDIMQACSTPLESIPL